MELKAIETSYSGYRFRSRLEARWAVFFDHLGIKYQYEAEGYDLDGVWYLPDFWIPEWDAFVEVKANEPTDEEMAKCDALCTHSQKIALIFFGSPWPYEHSIRIYTPDYGRLPLDATEITGCFQCKGLHLQYIHQADTNRMGFSWKIGKHTCEDSPNLMLTGVLKASIRDAYQAARSARFER